jgi:hypothetical protein
MADRETILAALFTAVSATVADVGESIHFERNRNSPVEELKLPALIMWDGDESQIIGPGAAPSRNPLLLMEMRPEVWGFVSDAKATVGTTMNYLLRRVLRAIYSNADFATTVGKLTDVNIERISTGLGKGKKATADFGIQLQIRYTFQPTAS